MKKRQIISCILILVFVVLSVSGCSKKKTDENKINNPSNQENKSTDKEAQVDQNKNHTAGGRYLEEEIELPEIFSVGSTHVMRGKENQLELFTSYFDQEVSHKHYIWKDNVWEEQPLEWLNYDEIKMTSSRYVDDILYGEDGFYYIRMIDYSAKSRYSIYKVLEGNQLEQIKIAYLESKVKTERTNQMEQDPFIQGMDVMENGSIVIDDYNQDHLLLFPAADRSQITEVDLGTHGEEYERVYCVSGNRILDMSEDRTMLSVYHADTNSIEDNIELDFSKNASDTIKITEQNDKTIVIINRDGIHSIKEESSLLETIVDGQLNSMSMPSLYIKDIFVIEGKPESYLVVYGDGDGIVQMMMYQFDGTVSAVPEEELTIYSLKESETIRQAIASFQRINRNVKVNYIVSMEDETSNKSDYIRALNTELLEGKGADLFVLDGLFVDSYIEKGILLDLNDVLSTLINEEKIPAYIVEAFTTQGQIFQVPARFRVPVLYGEKEAVEAWDGLESVLSYVENHKDKNFISNVSGLELVKAFYSEYEEKIFTRQEGLHEEVLRAFLEDIKKIVDQMMMDKGEEVRSNHILFPRVLNYAGISAITGLEELKSVDDSMVCLAFRSEKGKEYKIIHDSFLPVNRIGINASSKKIEISKQFIEVLFSDKVQETDVRDGFPVNQFALNTWFQKEKNNIAIGITLDQYEAFMIGWPKQKEREELFQKITKATKAITINETVMEMILTESEGYFEGLSTIDQVVSAIKSKVDTYLSE